MLGFRCEIVIHPKLEIGWVILTNTSDFEFNRFDTYIANLILPAFTEAPMTDLAQYSGKYSLVGGTPSFRIYQEDGKLYTTYLTQSFPHTALQFSDNNTLVLKDLTGRSVNFNFLPDKKRKILLLNLNQLLWKKD